MNVLKNRKALYAGPTVFRFICTMSNVNELRSSLYPLSLPSLSSVPAMKPPLSFCLLYFFHSFFFPGFVLRCSPPSPLPRPDQSMQDFCVDWLASEGPRLPSMGTKTCREHREQEATNCCKLKNTNAHLSDRQPSSLSRLLLPYSGFLPQRLRPLYEGILVSLPLLIIM